VCLGRLLDALDQLAVDGEFLPFDAVEDDHG
jgi:hypothetical protein